MTTVFLSGSRKLGRLNDDIRQRVRNITSQSFEIVVGDANGADKALQAYLSSLEYPKVTVYCAGARCRNNVGAWPIRHIEVPSNLRGREFYTHKDKAMARKADYGLVLWDGKSAGSIENVLELLRSGKRALVYLSPKKTFYSIASVADLRGALDDCETEDLKVIDGKVGLSDFLAELGGLGQLRLDFSPS